VSRYFCHDYEILMILIVLSLKYSDKQDIVMDIKFENKEREWENEI